VANLLLAIVTGRMECGQVLRFRQANDETTIETIHQRYRRLEQWMNRSCLLLKNLVENPFITHSFLRRRRSGIGVGTEAETVGRATPVAFFN